MTEHIETFWSETPEALLDALGSTSQGLDAAMARKRLETVGPNVLRARRKVTPLRLLLDQLKSPLLLILVFAAAVSLVTGELIDATIVLAIIVASTLLGFAQEYRANNAVEQLRSRVRLKANVLRGDRPQQIPADEVVPGDVVLLSAGSLIPADGVLLEADDFFVSQAALTGETFPVEKTPGVAPARAGLAERSNCVWMGTNVASGSARALIVRTGPSTAYGRIAERLTEHPPQTEFERGVRQFGNMLTQVMLLLVLIVFAINVILQKPAIDSLLFSVALAVGVAPELLPAIISITLSKGAQRMAKRGVIVRQLAAIENLGSMDTLCTDKTGTLTLGVVHLDGAVDPGGQPSDRVFRLAYLNAHFQTGLTNPLDEAINAQAAPDIASVIKTEEIPWDFVRKRLSVAVLDEREPGKPVSLITKGAFRGVLDICTQVTQADGSVSPLDEREHARLEQLYAGWSEQGIRVLGVAVKTVPAQPAYTAADEAGMLFSGFLLFLDPPKPDAQQAITDLNTLGVGLKVITGDNWRVATHVAGQVGLPVIGLVTGAQMDEVSDEALPRLVDRTNIFAEVDPNQKERIIAALRKGGHVVGYMGDGINDAPALHAADVGISVDSAVDVAKEAASFVLLEQSLDVLRQGIEEGRRTFANTLKYVFTTTSANFGNMFSMAGLSLVIKFLPLLPKQILLNNFLSDFPAMAIATDDVDRELVDKPRRWNVAFIRKFMVVFGLVSSVFDLLTFGILLLVLRVNEAQFQTGWFVESLITELFILLVVRTRRPLFRSKPGRWLWISTLLVGLSAIAIPYLGLETVFGFVPLPPATMALLLGITLLYVVANEIAKRVFYRHVHM